MAPIISILQEELPSVFLRSRKILISNRKVIFIESVLAFLIFWEVAVRLFDSEGFFSSPILLALGIYEIVIVTGEAWPHVIATSKRIGLSFAFTMVVGTTIGVIMGITKFWNQLLTIYVTMALSIPGLLAAVFSSMFFGISDLSPMVAVTIMTTPLISITIREAVDDLDVNLLEMSGAFNVPRRRVIWRVVIRGIAPALFGTARYAFAVAWKITNLTEVIIAQEGIGFMIRFGFQRFNSTAIVQYVLLFSLLILTVEFGVIRQIEKRVFAHREDVSVGFGGA